MSSLARISPTEIQQLNPTEVLARYVPADQHVHCLPIVQQAINQGDAAALVEVIKAFRGTVKQVEANSNRLAAYEKWAQGVDDKLDTLTERVSALQLQNGAQFLPPVVNNYSCYNFNFDLSDRRDQSDHSTRTSHTETNSFGVLVPAIVGLALAALVTAFLSEISVETYQVRPTGYEIVPTQ